MKVNEYKVFLGENSIPYLAATGKTVVDGRRKYDNPETVADICCSAYEMHRMAEEITVLAAFDTAGHLVGLFEIGHGTIDKCILSAREIFVRALLCGAHHIILLHNHPSGDTTPSAEDMAVTERIREAGKLMNIPLYDHIIIAGGSNRLYFSFKEENLVFQT